MENPPTPPLPATPPSTSPPPLDPIHLEFSHYNHIASSALTLVLNNDWSTALSILQSHLDSSIVISATHVYVCMLKLFLHPCSSNLHHVLADACKVIERCKKVNQDIKESISQDATIKANQTLQLLLNDIISSQCTISHSIISIINGSDIISSAFHVKKAFVFHKRLYAQLLHYVETTYTDDTTTNNNNNKNQENNNNNKANTESIGRYDLNNNTTSTITNQASRKADSKPSGLVWILDGLLKPINKRLFEDSVLNSLIPQGRNKLQNNDEDEEDGGEEEDEDDGRLENIYGFVNMGVLMKLSENYDVFRGPVGVSVKEAAGIFSGMFDKKTATSSNALNGHDANTLIFNKAHLLKLVGLVSFGYGLSLSILLILPHHPLLTTAITFLGLTDSTHQRPFEAFEMMMVSALSGSFVSPISCCLLLHFLCIHRHHFNFSENHFAPERNTKLIERLLGEFEKYGSESVFGFYFKAKMSIIKGRIKEGLKVLKSGMSEANLDEQVKGLCEYDLCRVYMMKFDWSKSSKTLNRLLDSLVVPHPYYSYMLTISLGARGKFDIVRLNNVANMGKKNKYRKEFFSERVSYLVKEEVWQKEKESLCRMLCYEMIYMWNAFRVLKIQQLDTVVGVCQEHLEGPFHSLACLLTGVCLATLIEKRVKKSLLTSERFYGIESWFLQALQTPLPHCREDHVMAMSCYEMGSLKEREHSYESAKGWYRRAKSFDRKNLVFKWSMVEEMRVSLEKKEKEWRKEKGEKEEKECKDCKEKKQDDESVKSEIIKKPEKDGKESECQPEKVVEKNGVVESGDGQLDDVSIQAHKVLSADSLESIALDDKMTKVSASRVGNAPKDTCMVQ